MDPDSKYSVIPDPEVFHKQQSAGCMAQGVSFILHPGILDPAPDPYIVYPLQQL
jgi:hypothetical protein